MAGNEPVSSSKNANAMAEEKEKLPSPALKKSGEENEDDPAKHQGRVRSFPHERGSWSGFIYIDYNEYDGLMDMQYQFLTKLRTTTKLCFESTMNIHVSLTKTFSLRYHNIMPFVENVQEQLSTNRRLRVEFDGVDVYVNEKRTRTFVGLRVAQRSYPALNEIVSKLDGCMREYQQPEFYKDPTYHVSLVWTVGDFEEITSQNLPLLVPIFERIYDEDYTDMTQAIKTLSLQCGNKSFTFNLE